LTFLTSEQKGQLGSFVVSQLATAGYTVTVLTRSIDKLGPLPSGVTGVEVDYSSVPSLTTALKGKDVLIATLAMDAISFQFPLLEAAIAAGVKRYIPSEYSGITLDPVAKQMPPLKLVMDAQKAALDAAEEGKIEYTIIAPGGFLNLMLNAPIVLDWEHATARLYDGGESKMSVSRLSTVAKAIRSVLDKGDQYKNKIVKVHDGIITQAKTLAIAKQEKPETKWTEIHVDTVPFVEDGLKKLADGEASPELVAAVVLAKSFGNDVRFWWNEEELDNKDLGIDGLTNEEIEDLIRARARGEMVDVPNDHEGPWRIDLR
jgi:hypothetical protein